MLTLQALFSEAHRVKDILRSYGATTTIFSFMKSFNVLEFQRINKWMYQKGVSRVQKNWKFVSTQHMFYLTYGDSLRFSKTLVRYESLSGEIETLSDPVFDFYMHRTVKVKSHLYTVDLRDLSVCRYSDLMLSQEATKMMLAC